ncbi:MAG: polyprenyl diphosphate synthase [Candidatus Saccharimonadales bacterium]
MIDAWRQAEEDSRNNTGGMLALCFNYGGFREITDAVKNIVQTGIGAEDITDDLVKEHLYLPEIPPVDLMIRTSGEQRLSGFMLPRMAYAELYFSPKPWPAFTVADLHEAFSEYSHRQRRFGGN